MKIILTLFVTLFLKTTMIFAQSSEDWIFDDSTLPEVYIIIEQDSLDQILDEENWYSDYEYPATFIFKRETEIDTVFEIGFRIRGNTSRSSAKKSFKVSFNTFIQGREYYGLDKMNLNGEHNDPSIIRSKLSWDIFNAFDVPAPRANHVKLFINDEYYGLYINVEHIDDEFVQNRFGGEEGNLYKNLWPADLSYIDENPDSYKWSPDWADRRVYDLKTNNEEDDYSDLASLISFLEHASTSEFENQIEEYINVDGVIRWMAIDILTGNWDNYWYNQNNYYLYFNTNDQRFEFIPYDYDNTFGIDWVGQDWGIRDINSWGQDKPLTRRILEVDEYENRLHFYINKIIDEYFNEEFLFPEIDRLKALTEVAAEADTFRTKDYDYGIAEYHASFSSALGGHVDYGLKPYITTRINSAKEQLNLTEVSSFIRGFSYEIVELEASGKGVFNFYAEIVKDTTERNYAVLSIGSPVIKSIPTADLVDNGTGIDQMAGDGIYSGQYQNSLVADYIGFSIAIFDSMSTIKTQTEFITIHLSTSTESVVINEFMASNSSTFSDEGGAFADWLEIYNPTDSVISMNGFYLTDNLTTKDKWAFPDTTIQPNGYLLVWIDDDEKEGPMHASFNLNKDGEAVGIFEQYETTFRTIDAVSFGLQTTDISFGRNGDGGDEFVTFDNPTPGTPNGLINSSESENETPYGVKLFQNYPNPFNPTTNITFQLESPSEISLQVFTIDGRLVQTLANSRYSSGSHTVLFDAFNLSSGMYFYRLQTKNQSLTKRLVLIK